MAIKEVFPEYELFEKSVAAELREQRRKHNISLKEMGEKIGMHSNTVGKCENQGFGLGLDIIYGYARVCNRPVSAFTNPGETNDDAKRNPLTDLTEEELKRYSAVLQKLFQVFSDEQLNLSGECLYDATRLVAKAVQEQRLGN
ncbi:MAG: helix-turn-helix transcriptional regulator [Deltaproteobacteria bacterium]|nr:helix-turn-helix transcriptional regulator [Deltaproteobacteria bacterium]